MSDNSLKLIAIDDDPGDLELLRRYLLSIPGRTISLAAVTDAEEGYRRLVAEGGEIVFLDYRLGGKTGLEVLRDFRGRGVKAPIVMLTGHGDEELAAELMKAGASDYLPKARLSPDSLEQVLRSALRIAQLEKQAAAAEEKLRLAAKVFDNILEGVMVTDAETVILSVNPAFCAITGYTSDEVVGKKPTMLRSDVHDELFFRQMWSDLAATGHWRGEIWNMRKSGDTFLAWQTISAVRDPGGRVSHYVSVFYDITERKRHEDFIRYQAYHDLLTGLPNRQLFSDRLGQALLHARREGEMVGVMFLDLDHFKEVNDTLGHNTGDLLLQEVARRLPHSVRKGDTIARFGGDEFVLLLPNIQRIHNAVVLAEKILAAFDKPFKLEGAELSIRPSIGISLFPRDGDQPEGLVRKADEAMYQAKQKGRNNFQLAS